MSLKNSTSLLGTAAASAVLGAFGFYVLSGCGGGKDSGPVLALVNGETITMDDFHKYMQSKPSVRIQTANGPAEARVSESLAFQALQDMIARQVTMQMAKDEGVFPTEQEVTKELEFQKKLQPTFLTQLTQAGLTLDRIKQSLTLNLAREKLITKGVNVTMQEAEEFIKSNPKQFMDPAKAAMLWIFARSEDRKKQVDSALQSGQTFSVVASQYSEVPGARQQGGRFPQETISGLPADLQRLVNATAEGRATDWFRMQDGFAQFFVEKKTPEKPIDMTPERKEYVRRQLAQQRGAQATDLSKRVLDKLLKSTVDVKERTLVEAWKRAFERFKEEQKVDVPAGPGSTEDTK